MTSSSFLTDCLWLQIDPQTVESGCLRVLPNSHTSGPFGLPREGSLEDVKDHTGEELVCEPGEGSVTFYRPLLVHSSMPPENHTVVGSLHRLGAPCACCRPGNPSLGWSWSGNWVGVDSPLSPSQRWVATPKL